MPATTETTIEAPRAGGLASLSSAEHRTLDGIFRHPMPHNLEWSNVVSLVEKIGTVEPKANNAYAFKVGHERHIMHKPHTKDLTSPEIIDLRHFLTRSGWSPEKAAGTDAAASSAAPSLLLAIQHHEAKIYEIETSAADASEHVIKPYDPHHFLHHMRHKDQSRERGQKQAEDTSFYVRIAAALAPGGRIVLVGHGKGASNAAHHLAEYLREHHHDIYARVVVELTADLSSLTDPQLLALGAQALSVQRAHPPTGAVA
jgi:hypothetical protein